MADRNWFLHTSPKIVNALRMGGYACFIPCVIEPVLEGEIPPLAWFPVSICFTGLRWTDEMDDAWYEVSCYWFDPQTYKETPEYQSLCYRSRHLNDKFKVVIARSKTKKQWEGRKLRGKNVLVSASGSDLTRFVIQLTMLGPDKGEHVESRLTWTETASTGIWVYDPATAEVARSGRLQ